MMLIFFVLKIKNNFFFLLLTLSRETDARADVKLIVGIIKSNATTRNAARQLRDDCDSAVVVGV